MMWLSLVGLLLVDWALVKMLIILQTTAGVPELDGVLVAGGLALTAISLIGSKLLQKYRPQSLLLSFLSPIAQAFLKRVLYGLAYGTILFAVLIAVRTTYRLDGGRVWRDTRTYLDSASLPLASDDFWFGLRAPTLPLVYKVFGLTSQVIDTPAFDVRSKRLVLFQTAFSVLAFSSLGLVISAVFIQTRWLKPMVFGLFLAFGLNIAVSQWNKLLLSESLSTSFLIVLVTLALIGLYGWVHWEQVGMKWWKPYLLILAVAAFFYALTRDTNMYFLLMLTAMLFTGLIFKAIRFHPGRWAYTALMIILSCIVVFQYLSFNRGVRWLYPFVNILYERILPVPAARTYFLERGLPMADELDDILTIERRQLHVVLEEDEHYRPLYEWVVVHGASTYAQYLLSKPLDALLAPFQDFGSLVSPDSSEYRIRLLDDPPWIGQLRSILYPGDMGVLLIWLILLVIGAAWQSNQPSGFSWQIVPGVLLLTLYPLMFIIWHGDSIELERHAYQIDFQIRLALWLGTVFVVETALRYFSTRAVGKQ